MRFMSDNAASVHPKVWEALRAAEGVDSPYDGDALSQRLDARFSELFGREATVLWVATGTAANCIALATMCPPHGGVVCHREAHIEMDEGGAPGFYLHGAKLLLAGRSDGGDGAKLTPQAILDVIDPIRDDVHQVQPHAISITQASEYGRAYRPEEIAAISRLARERGLALHMDGARFANALAASNASAAALTWRAGVDVMTFGATKNGAMGVEAVVFFDPALADHFDYRVKRGAHVISKSRFLGAQMAAYLENGLWLDNARHANAMAARLAAGLAGVPGVALPVPTQANEVFAILPRPLHDALQAAGAHYYEWPRLASGLAPIGADQAFVRMVCSFRTDPAEVDQLIAAARAARA
jgi:threonine aldolase